MSIRTLEGKVTWLSIVETSLAWFHQCCTLSSWGLLHILLFSVWSLKWDGAWNHLSLRSDKSLPSWLMHPLNTLLHGVEGRSSRRRSNTRPRVAALLTLAFLLALVWQYSSPILKHKGLVCHGMKILEVMCFKSIAKSIIQSIKETLLLLLIGIHVVRSVAGMLRETSDVLANCHGSLLQILELLLLKFDNPLRYMMRSESHLELIPVDAFGFFMSFYICIPPIRCRAYQFVWIQQGILSIVALHNLKLLLYHLQPVIDVHGFHRVRKGQRLGPLEFSKLVSLLWLRCLLVLLHVSQGLLHGLEHWSLHHHNLLQGWWGWWVGSVVVLSVGIVVPCVDHSEW
jgi:hypothetical protein